MKWGHLWGTVPAPLKSYNPNKCNKDLTETSRKVKGLGGEGDTPQYVNSMSAGQHQAQGQERRVSTDEDPRLQTSRQHQWDLLGLAFLGLLAPPAEAGRV